MGVLPAMLQGGRFLQNLVLIALELFVTYNPLTARTAGVARPASSDQTVETRAEPVYDPGGDVKSPKLIHYVEPEFASSSEQAFVDGTVKVVTVVTDQGLPTDVHVVKGLNDREDKAAIQAVKQWRFRPGTKAGQSVNVRVTVQIAFHLL